MGANAVRGCRHIGAANETGSIKSGRKEMLMPRPQTKAGEITTATCFQIADSLKPRVGYLDLGALLKSGGVEIDAVAGRQLPMRHYGLMQPIAFATDHEPPLLYITSGAVDIYFPCSARADGGRARVTRTGPGILIGEADSLGLSMMSAVAEAAEETRALAVDLPTAEALMAALPEWRRLIGERLVRAEVELMRERFSAVESLLIAALLELAGEDGVVRNVSQQELASRLRVTRLMVLRALMELRHAGLLEWKWKTLTLLDRDGLKRRVLFGV